MKPQSCPVNALRRRILCAIAACGAALLPQHIARTGGFINEAFADTRKEPGRRSYHLRIEKRKLAGNQDTLRVTKGDIVEFHWTTDEAMTLHLHGYNLEARLEPGKRGLMTFSAHATGRFPVTAHGLEHGAKQETTLFYLEVHPR